MNEKTDLNDGQIQLAVTGAHCASCVNTIESALKSVDGITGAHMNLADRTATATGHADPQALIRAVESSGYGASQIEDPDAADDRKQEEDRKQYKTLLVMMVTSENQLIWLTLGVVTLGVMTVTGGHFFSGAWKAFRHHNANMDTLIALGTGTAWVYSMTVASIPDALPEMARHVYFEASAMIIGLINLGQALELRAKGKTSEAVRRLLDLRAKTARVIRDGEEQDLPLSRFGRVIISAFVRVKNSRWTGRLPKAAPALTKACSPASPCLSARAKATKCPPAPSTPTAPLSTRPPAWAAKLPSHKSSVW